MTINKVDLDSGCLGWIILLVLMQATCNLGSMAGSFERSMSTQDERLTKPKLKPSTEPPAEYQKEKLPTPTSEDLKEVKE